MTAGIPVLQAGGEVQPDQKPMMVYAATYGSVSAAQNVDLDRALVHVAFNYVVRGGRRIRKDTKTHQDRWLAIDPVTCTDREPRSREQGRAGGGRCQAAR